MSAYLALKTALSAGTVTIAQLAISDISWEAICNANHAKRVVWFA